jgi:hypothetical protein
LVATEAVNVDKTDAKGISPLWYAVWGDHLEVVEILMQHTKIGVHCDRDRYWAAGHRLPSGRADKWAMEYLAQLSPLGLAIFCGST